MSDWNDPRASQPPPAPREEALDAPAREKKDYLRPGLELLAGGRRAAIPLTEVREVALEQAPISRIPRTLPPIRGAINLRGRVVAVVELAGLLGLQPAPAEPERCRVVLLEGAAAALWVEEVVGICELEVPDAGRELLAAPWILERAEEMLGPAVAVMDYLGGRAFGIGPEGISDGEAGPDRR